MPKLNKQQIEAIAAQGFNLYQQGKLDEAKVIFEGLTAIDSTNYMGYAGLGAVALAKEPPQLDAALANLQKAAEINPSDPSVHANLGEALLRQAKFQEAATEFDKALELDPQGKDPGANRARAILTGLEVMVTEGKKVLAAA